jgi:hypothetical protein
MLSRISPVQALPTLTALSDPLNYAHNFLQIYTPKLRTKDSSLSHPRKTTQYKMDGELYLRLQWNSKPRPCTARIQGIILSDVLSTSKSCGQT